MLQQNWRACSCRIIVDFYTSGEATAAVFYFVSVVIEYLFAHVELPWEEVQVENRIAEETSQKWGYWGDDRSITWGSLIWHCLSMDVVVPYSTSIPNPTPDHCVIPRPISHS